MSSPRRSRVTPPDFFASSSYAVQDKKEEDRKSIHVDTGRLDVDTGHAVRNLQVTPTFGKLSRSRSNSHRQVVSPHGYTPLKSPNAQDQSMLQVLHDLPADPGPLLMATTSPVIQGENKFSSRWRNHEPGGNLSARRKEGLKRRQETDTREEATNSGGRNPRRTLHTVYRSEDDSDKRNFLSMMSNFTNFSSSLPLMEPASELAALAMNSPPGEISLMDSMDEEIEISMEMSPTSSWAAEMMVPPTPKHGRRRGPPTNLFSKTVSTPLNKTMEYGSPNRDNPSPGSRLQVPKGKKSSLSATTGFQSFRAVIEEGEMIDEEGRRSPYSVRNVSKQPQFGLPLGSGRGFGVSCAHIGPAGEGGATQCYTGAQAIVRFVCQPNCPLFPDAVYFNHIDIARLIVCGGGVEYCLKYLRVLVNSGVQFMSIGLCTEGVQSMHAEHMRICRAVMDHLTASSCNLLPRDVVACLRGSDAVKFVEKLGTKRDTVVYLWILDSRSESFANLTELREAVRELHATWSKNRMDQSILTPEAAQSQKEFNFTTVSSFLRSSQCKLFPDDVRRSMDIDEELLQDVIRQVGEHNAVKRFKRLANKRKMAFESFQDAANEVLEVLTAERLEEERQQQRMTTGGSRLTMGGLKVSIPSEDNDSYFNARSLSQDSSQRDRWMVS